MNAAPPRTATQYRKPRRINTVSVTLLLIAAAAAYVAYALWPVYTLRAAVKGELEDALPRLYQLNLRPDTVAKPEIAKIRKALYEKIQRMGVKDKKLVVEVIRDRKKVTAAARFTTAVTWPVWGRTSVFALAPRAETDAARVEW